MKKTIIAQVSVFLISTTAFVSCAKVDPSSAPKNALQLSQEVQSFPLEETNLMINLAFLWKKSVTKEDVDQMDANGKSYAKLKILLVKRAGLNQKQPLVEEGIVKVKAGLASIDAGLAPYEQGLSQVDAGLVQVGSDLEKANQERRIEEDQLIQDPLHDPSRLKEILRRITALEAQKSGLTEKKSELKTQIEGLNSKKTAVSSQLEELNGKLAQIKGGLKQIADKLKEAIGDAPPEMVLQKFQKQEFPKYSEEFSSPDRITVKKDASGVFVEIIGLDVYEGKGPENFSVIDGTIRNVSYQERGGVAKFELITKNGVLYSYEMSRNNYDMIKDGYVSYYSRIIRTGVDKSVRHGTGKFLGFK